MTTVSDRWGGEGDTHTVRRGSVVAGVGILLFTALALYGDFVVLGGIVTPGDASQTADAVTNAEGTFHIGVLSLFLVAILDVFVAWGLYLVFSPESRRLSQLAAWFRIVYAGIFVVAISNLLSVVRLLNRPEYLTVYSDQQLQALALQRYETFNDVWSAGLLVFGVHLVVLGYLAYRADYVPTVLGALLVIAGLGYAFDSVVDALALGLPFQVSLITFVGEIALLGWLLLRGRRIELDAEETAAAG
ncbi:DUF4386 domain-containing protein [Haladaptatus sp. NG-WS-4]